jgi:uncharacterized protein (DUF362 family)
VQAERAMTVETTQSSAWREESEPRFVHRTPTWRERLRDALIPREPPVPTTILGERAARFASLPVGGTVCIKLSSAYDLPYPFSMSRKFVARVVAEIHTANPTLKILLTEGGVGGAPILEVAAQCGLTSLPHATFVDAESSEPVFVPNPNPQPFQAEGFHLPSHWVEADARVLLTTCKLRTHHFQRAYSGGIRNLIGLLPRQHYKLAQSRRAMRSLLHQQGMDAMVADLYTTAGKNLLTILDGRLLGRQDEHFPMRFTRRVGSVLVAEDPYLADHRMSDLLRLPFSPPYLVMLEKAGFAPEAVSPVSVAACR